MKKNLILTTLLFSIHIVHANPIHDLENAIKEGNHTKVVELSSNLKVSAQEFNRLVQSAYSALEAQKVNRLTINNIWHYTKTGTGILVGATINVLGGALAACGFLAAHISLQEKEYREVIKTILVFEPIGLAIAFGGGALCEYSIQSILRRNKRNEEQCSNVVRVVPVSNAARILSVVKALAVTQDQTNTNMPE